MNSTVNNTMGNATITLVMKVGEFAKHIGMAKHRVYAMTHIEGFPSVKIGNTIYIHVKKAEKWLEDVFDNNPTI